MSEILELVLQLIFGLLEFFAESWFGSASIPDTRTSRIALGTIIALVALTIWLELR